MNLIIFAVNIHTGGGRRLLDQLLISENYGSISQIYVDQRYPLPPQFPSHIQVTAIKPSLWGRFKAELELHKTLKHTPKESVLFFGNLPPFFKPKNPAYLFLQNCFLLKACPPPWLSLKTNLRLTLERFIVKFFTKNVAEIWVQTPWMKQITQAQFPKKAVSIKLLLPEMPKVKTPLVPDVRQTQFLYIGSFSPHKRFDFFLQSLRQLDTVLKKEIHVTAVLDSPASAANELKFKNIKLTKVFKLTPAELAEVYNQCRVLVCTSLTESFCLPLYEAQHYGLQILAPYAGYTQGLEFEINLFDGSSPENCSLKMNSLIKP